MYREICEIPDKENYQELWGVAIVWNGKIGAEYNYCIDDVDRSAIYRMDDNGEEQTTDYSDFEHYEIDLDDKDWQEKLLDKMQEFVRERSK